MQGQIYRSRLNRRVGGVCGGLADYFKIDATILRLLWAISILFFGTGFLVYLIAWLILPDAPY